jgi:hypothetical protein
VLVEKPAARTLRELEPVLKAASRGASVVRVGFNHRYHRAMRKAKELISAGALGPLMYVRGRYGHGGRVGYEKEWRANPERSGGGELIDQGPHLIDLARWFLNAEFPHVEGMAHTYFWDMPVDDNAFMLLRTADDKAAFLHVSCTEWKNLFSMEIYERAIVTAFKTHGIDLTDKVIADAPQPLYIVASNMTTHNPTVFTKQVRILDALRCSSCLPILFQPQVLYNHVYLDGGLFVDCLSSLTPSDCLVLHISDPGEKLYASELETIPLSAYLHRIYRSMRGRPTSSNVLWLQNSSVGLLQEMTPEQKDALCAQGTSQTLAFMSKRLAKERQESIDGALAGKVGEDGTGL